MQNKEQSALLVHRENYEVPKGQEQAVHIKIAKLDARGNIIEQPRIIREGVKFFESVAQSNLITQGYTIEILYHPLGKYTSVRINDKDEMLKSKDAEIARLKAEMAEKKGAQGSDESEIAKVRAEAEAEIAKVRAEAEAMKKELEKLKAKKEKKDKK